MLAKDLQNPFIHIRNWIKGEIMNLTALSNAIAAKESCEGRKQQAISKVADERKVLAKMQQGNFTLRGAFMG